MTTSSKPKLSTSLSHDQFSNYYWLKKELIDFCKQHHLPTSGSKEELSKRVVSFLKTGKVIKPKTSRPSGKRDSDQIITCNTLVKHYKNDTKTRDFFVSQIGKHFRFNHYLRQFTNPNNITDHLTYGDLVNGWLAEEAKHDAPTKQKNIGKQFEYNQFIRDYFAHETGKSLADAIKAWKKVSSVDGPNTYSYYLSLPRA